MSQINNVLQPLCGDFERISQILPCYFAESVQQRTARTEQTFLRLRIALIKRIILQQRTARTEQTFLRLRIARIKRIILQQRTILNQIFL